MSQIKVAVVTGRHGFDVIGFQQLFRALPEADCYVQHMEDFSIAPSEVRAGYDVIVFYNMHMETPTGEGPWWEKGAKGVIEDLGKREQGILVLHHAVLAYPDWPLWSEIVGIDDRRFGFKEDQHLHIDVANPNHPITRGLAPFDIIDEVYSMKDAGPGSDILLTVKHPDSMNTVAWTRGYREARVFCLQGGHDNEAFANPSFRTIMDRGITWCARRL